LATFVRLAQLQAQDFVFQMKFTEAKGHSDSIVFGYDINATDSIDAAFNETNIIAIPLDTGLDVRITNEWRQNYLGMHATYHTKKQIGHFTCGIGFPLQGIKIKTKYWPVTATWNNALFNNTCRNGSLFTSVHPGGWWDTGSPSDLWRKALKLSNTVTFTSNNPSTKGAYGYINSHGDTISFFWHAFGDSTLLMNSINDISAAKQEFKVYPNPAKDKISLQLPKDFGKLKNIEIYAASGQLLLTATTAENINISLLNNGLYFVIVTNEKGQKLRAKLLCL